MPRVPPGSDYVSSQSVPGEAPFERATGTAFGGTSAAIAERGFNQIEQTGLTALGNLERHQAEIENEKERQRIMDAALTGRQTFEERMNQAENELRFGKTDPTTGTVTETPANSSDYYEKWKAKATAIRQDTISATSDGAVGQVLDSALGKTILQRSITAQHFANNLFVQEQGAEADTRADAALRLYVGAQDPAEGETALNSYRDWLDTKIGVFGAHDAQQRMYKFSERVLGEKAQILARTPAGREQLYKDVEEGKFEGLDPNRLSRIVANAQRADARLENVGRENERAVAAAREDRKIEIATLVNKRNLPEAQRLLDFYVNIRAIDAKDYEHLQDEIAKGPRAPASDPAVAQRVLLDVYSVTPRTKQDEIDTLVARGALSLDDGVKAKARLSETLKAQLDKTKTENMSRHAQAEQNLRASLNWHPDMIGALEAKIEGDPRPWLYDKFLHELVDRSNAYRGTEDPIAVERSFRPEINKTMKESKPSIEQIQKMFPDEVSLEKARQRGWITQGDVDEILPRIRQQRAPLPTQPTQPAQAAPKAQRVR